MMDKTEVLDRRKDGGSSPGSDKFDIHFQALCSAVEQERLEKVRSILEHQTHVNVNGVNGDGFTLLDLAFMTGNQHVLNLVVHHGGKEGAFFPSPESVSAHILSLITESRKQVEKFNQLVKMAASGATLSQVQLKECEKQLSLWQKRLTTMKKLKAGFDSAGCPHAPVEVQASVTGSNCINVKVKEPEKFGNSLYTKFKIQWSFKDTFSDIEGEIEVKTIHTLEYNIENLIEGKRYFIRASFGNPKGYGPFSASKPRSLVPSSWRNVDDRQSRLSDQLDTVTNLLDTVVKNRPADLADYSVEDDLDTYEDGRMRKKGLLQLFQTAPKFTKTPRLGVYLTSLMFNEDKVLLTNEDHLPLVEVSEDVPSSSALQTDFHWFMKMCFMWPDVGKLRQDMSKLSSQSFRFKLLSAATTMQSALGTENLGVLYYRPFKHSSGTVIFSLVHHVKSPKSLVSLSLKWTPLTKAQRRGSVEDGDSMDMIRESLREQILFNQVSGISVSRGLHLCYLQSHSTIDSMSVVASNTSPSILPYIKMRENPHVTLEEWQWIRNMGANLSPVHPLQTPSPTTNFLVGEGEEGSELQSAASKALRPTESQYLFGKLVQHTATRLFAYLEVAEDERDHHRIYDHEIIELSPDISLILILPRTESVCSVTDTSMAINLNRNDLLLVPLQAWEVLHLSTYHRKLLAAYAKLSSILDVDLALARQSQREAFSNTELEAAGVQLASLMEHYQGLEDTWKGLRWILDVLSIGRLKNAYCGITLSALTDWYLNQPDTPDDSQFVQSDNLQVRSANVFRLDTLKNWNSRPRDSPASDSGTLNKPGLSRTPTTRSDPLEFNVMNKENEVQNFPAVNLAHVRTRLLQDGLAPVPDQSSSYSSLTNSIDSNDNEYVTDNKFDNHNTSLDPTATLSGRFLNAGSTSPEPNILQVFAAYDTGLASGTSVRIQVSTATTAREVVDLVIKQLNMAVILKGKEGPLYENEKLKNFCLVAVIGSRERCLRDDFKPLNLQNPWKKGRLFVRMKHDLLAAIEHISRL